MKEMYQGKYSPIFDRRAWRTPLVNLSHSGALSTDFLYNDKLEELDNSISLHVAKVVKIRNPRLQKNQYL